MQYDPANILHKHDCDECTYIGEYYDHSVRREYDLYFHVQSYEGCLTTVELIARYSSDGPDYLATSVWGDLTITSKPLNAAHSRFTLHLLNP